MRLSIPAEPHWSAGGDGLRSADDLVEESRHVSGIVDELRGFDAEGRKALLELLGDGCHRSAEVSAAVVVGKDRPGPTDSLDLVRVPSRRLECSGELDELIFRGYAEGMEAVPVAHDAIEDRPA